MSVHPGPPISAPPVTAVEPATALSAADRIGPTSAGGRHTDVVGSNRTCGRCRLEFPIGADVHPMELRDWWACTACTEALMPTHGHRSPA